MGGSKTHVQVHTQYCIDIERFVETVRINNAD